MEQKPEQQIDIGRFIDELKAQRNAAMDQAAALVARMAVVEAELAALKEPAKPPLEVVKK